MKKSFKKSAALLAGAGMLLSPVVGVAAPHTPSTAVEQIQKKKTTLEERLKINDKWITLEALNDSTVLSDMHAFPKYHSSLGGGAFGGILDLIYPNYPGTKRVMTMPSWGKNKMSRKIDYKVCKSKHFEVRTYGNKNESKPCDKDSDDPLAAHTLALLENQWQRYWNHFKFGSFKKKQGFFLYNSRRDYMQSNLMSLPVLEMSAGFMDPGLEMDIAMPFDGHFNQFDETLRHEEYHAYSLTVGNPKNLPTWIIEGFAEYFGNGKDNATTLRVIRDLTVNAPEFHYGRIEAIGWHPVVYHLGSNAAQIIEEEYGEAKLEQIIKNSRKHSFDDNIQKTFGMSKRDFYNFLQKETLKRFGHLSNRQDISDQGFIATDYVLGAHGHRYLTVGFNDTHIQLTINTLDQKKGKVTKKVVADGKMGDQAFGFTADLDDKVLAYVMNNTVDEIRVRGYTLKKGSFKLGKTEKYTVKGALKGIQKVHDVLIVDDDRIAFVGQDNDYDKGKKYTNIYMLSRKSGKVTKLTDDPHSYSDLDYHDGKLIFSKEKDGNAHLHMMDVDSQTITQITKGKGRDHGAQFSPDGKRVVFHSNRHGVNNLYMLDMDTYTVQRFTDAKVQAFNAHWVDKDTIYLNSNKLLGPTMHAAKVPTAAQFAKARLLHAVPDDKRSKLTDTESMEVTFRGKDYKVVRALPLEDRVLIQGMRKNGKKVGPESRFFEYKDGKVIPAGKKKFGDTVAFYKSNPKAKAKMEKIRKEHSIMHEIISPDNYVLYITNNKLTLEDQKYEATAYVMDPNTLETKALFHLKKMAPMTYSMLSDNKVLVKEHDTSYVIYDHTDMGKKKKVFSGVVKERVTSPDRRHVAVLSGSKVMIYDAKTGKQKKVSVGTRKGQHLQFTDDGLFFTQKIKNGVKLHRVTLDGKHTKKTIALPKGKITGATANKDKAALVLKHKKQERLLLVESNNFKDISGEGVDFGNVHFYNDTLVYHSKDVTNRVTLGARGKRDSVAVMHARVDDDNLVYTDGNTILNYNMKHNMLTTIANDGFGFDMNDDFMVWSEYENGEYTIFIKDRFSGKTKKVQRDSCPRSSGMTLYFTMKRMVKLVLLNSVLIHLIT